MRDPTESFILDLLKFNNSEYCPTHYITQHDFFISYLLESDESSPNDPANMPKQIYDLLSAQQTNDGRTISVFWDSCFNITPENWEKRILKGLLNSKVILLLISRKILDRIAERTEKEQDNILFEYESALLRGKLEGIHIVPIFLPEGEEHSFAVNFPDTVHRRSESAQTIVDKLRNGLNLEDVDFLGTVKKTMHQLSGFILPHLSRDKEHFEELAKLLLDTLETGAISHSSHFSYHPTPFIPLLPLPLPSKKEPKYFPDNITDDSEGYFSAGSDSDFEQSLDYSSEEHVPTPRPPPVKNSSPFLVNYILILALVVVIAKLVEQIL